MHTNNIISGTRRPIYPGPASAAPPGRIPPAPYPPLCRMAASPYPAYGSSRKPLYRRPGKRSAAGR
ncbi:hypothetical protein KD913_08425 [Klebsiella pneumoniae]